MAEIIVFLAARAGRAGQGIAARYVAAFDGLYDRLAMHHASGPARAALGPNIRIAIVSPYIAIHEHDPRADSVTVPRIVHGRRKISGQTLKTI